MILQDSISLGKNDLENDNRFTILHRGKAALRINCDTLDTFRTKESKEIIETAKINNIQQKYTDCVEYL